MKCPDCQTANPDGALFCLRCGQALAGVGGPDGCPRCGSPTAPEARYCVACGHSLTGAQARLEQYIPRQLLNRLEAARSSHAMAGERRVVTMLFCDVKGSTALAETLDPEEWADVMNGAFEHLIAPVYRYEGTLARLMGDAILAFFGAPIAHEDDPERAVRAGLDIVQGIQPYREEIQRTFGLGFDVRVGINTGLVVVGEVGSDLRVEYTAMGDAINLAARMEQTAQPGAVQISEDTYRLVAPLFDVESLGGIEVKGKKEPVRVYRVLGTKAQPGRVRGIRGLDAPLVGRQRELAALRRALDETGRGTGHVVCLTGEAGLGKSRLIDALRRDWEATGAGHWSESRSTSYDTTRPYGQFQQQVRAMCDLTEGDPPEAAREKIGRALDETLADAGPEVRTRVARVFGVVLGLPSGEDGAELEGEALKRDVFDAMSMAWRAWGRGERAVFVFDDLHWADPASLELLTHLFRLSDEAPLLFVCAFRPEREGPLEALAEAARTRFAHHYTGIALQPLSDQQSATLVSGLLNLPDLPPAIGQLVRQKADGNPFYVEEIVRALIDGGVLAREGDAWRVAGDVTQAATPGSLHALLVARIDRLPEDVRRTLQMAAVVGRTFYYRVLAPIANAGPALDGHLDTLQSATLVEETASQPELAYSFLHALTQEAAYESILLKHRRDYHRKVGETLEDLFPEREDEFAPLLGHHFYAAGDDARTRHYYRLAGDAAARLYANAEAAAHYGRALEAARRIDTSTGDLIHLFSARGRALGLNSRYDDELATYEAMHELALERENRALELAALMQLSTLRAVINPKYDPARAQAHMGEALELARQLGDDEAQVRVLWNLLLLNSFIEQPHEAVTYGEQALELARAMDLRELLAYTLNDIHRAYLATGQLARALEVLEEARALWRDFDNAPMLSDNLTGTASVHYLRGEFDKGLASAQEANLLSVTADSLWGQAYSRTVTARIYHDQGEADKAILALEEAVTMGTQIGAAITRAIPRADLAWVYASLGAIERAREAAHTVRDIIKDEDMPSALLSGVMGNLAWLELLSGDLDAATQTLLTCQTELNMQGPLSLGPITVRLAEAELALRRASYQQAGDVADGLLADLTAWGARSHLADALYAKGRALRGLGLYAEALETFGEARGAAQTTGSLRSLWPVLLAMSNVAVQNGSREEAENLRQQASRAVNHIAGNITDSEVRTAFLSLPQIESIAGL